MKTISRRTTGAGRPVSTAASWLRVVFFAGLPLVAVALGGATARWSEGIVLCAVGGALLAAPPRVSLGKGINAVLAALVGLAATAFLPARWFSAPAWRTALTGDFGVTLPPTLSPQPWLSAESFALFLGGLGWFYLMATVSWTAEERPRAGRVFAGGVVAVAATCVALYRLHVEPAIWHAAVHYGPFPNRNQTADFLGIGALVALACAHLAWRGGRRGAAVGWLVGWAVVAAGIFNNFSRAGVGILFAGTAAYLASEMLRAGRSKKAEGRRQKVEGAGEGQQRAGATEEPVSRFSLSRFSPSTFYLLPSAFAVAVSLFLLLASGFMIFGGSTLQRVRPSSVDSAVTAATTDFRVGIQRDALDMIRDSPWCGVGIGSFEPVFVAYRHRSAIDMHIVHPESDWLWMTSELGWPAFLLVAAGCVLLARRVWPLRRGTDRPLRWAAALGVAAWALHGFVDVSAHRVGTALGALFLLGIALPGAGERDDFRTPTRWPTVVFRLLGTGLLAVGALWLLADRGKVNVPGSQQLTQLTALTTQAANAGDHAGTETFATQGLALDPVNWRLYLRRGTARLAAGGDREAALADFRRALYLEPFLSKVPATVAHLWADAGEPDLAISALLEACRREPRETSNYFDSIRQAANGDPVFLEHLAAATRRDPDMELVFLEITRPADLARRVAGIVAADPELRRYDDAQRTRLFRLWSSADAPGFAVFMETYPAWQKLGWRWWMEACAQANALDRACRIAAEHAPRPAIPPEAGGGHSLAELRLTADQTPNDPASALRLYRAQQAMGDGPAALATLHRMTTRPDCPAYFHYLEGTTATDAGQWETAWAAWRKYLSAVPGNG